MTIPWLTVLGLLPIIGGLALLFPMGRGAARPLGMLFSLLTLATGIGVAAMYFAGVNLDEQVPWIRVIGAYWAHSLDGMGLAMVLMTVVLTPVVLLAEWKTSDTVSDWSSQAFFALVLLLEGLAIFVFTAADVLLFYLFFEATLIPVYFLIAGFGGARRKYAAIKFLLFSLAGGLVMLASVIGLYAVSAEAGHPTYLLSELASMEIGGNLGRWLMLGFLFAFIVKAPMVPVHTWLPDAAENSTPGTATLLVGILDKIGTFGMIKFCLGLFGEASHWIANFMMILAVISVIWGALAAIASTNMMRLVAYTSVSHFGLIVLGIYAFTTPALTGSVFYMLNHGFSTAALFLVVGFLINRRGTADIAAFGGVQKVAPVVAGVLLVSGLASLSLPGMSSFVSEFMVLAGSWANNPYMTLAAILGMVLSAVYILKLYQRSMTGPIRDEVAEAFEGNDLNWLEKLVVVPIIGFLLFFGFVPNPAIKLVEPTAVAAMQSVGASDPEPQVEGVQP